MRKSRKAIIELETVFIIFDIIVGLALLYFIFWSSSDATIYEQTYAKQIALTIDSAKPNMTIVYDISKGLKINDKIKKPVNEIFIIDENSKEVVVSLGKRTGYRHSYFSDTKIDLVVDGGKLNIIVK